MASRRNKARRRYRKWAPASLYDWALKDLGKGYVTMAQARESGKSFARMMGKLCQDFIHG
jgi:hypothetical protein